MGLIASFILPILSQVPLVLQSPFDWVRAPVRLFEAVTRYHGTLTWLPNFAYNFCAKKIRDRELEGIDLSGWRAVINCSEPIHWKSHQMFLERFAPYGLRPEALATCYAMAENVFAVSQGGIDSPVVVDSIDSRQLLSQGLATPSQGEEAGMLLVSSGRLLDCTQVRIVDSRHQNLPERCLGEIALSSNCMLTGYYHRDDLTAKVFDQGWYLTGDMGYLANGELFVTGRKKDILIVGGKNIYPGDLERLAGDVPGIHPGRVVAFGVFNEESGTEDVVLVAEAEQEEMASGSEAARLANDIRQRINQGSDVVARAVKIVGRGWLIKTSSGKIARNANRDKYLGGSYPR
jgi:acyl-CoA synthetase (AMP-forming)/AMP-acid ligase II